MTLCYIPDCSCINPVPKPKILCAAQCEECNKSSNVKSSMDLFSYGYYIGHHEKWVCRRCYAILELEAHNKQMKMISESNK